MIRLQSTPDILIRYVFVIPRLPHSVCNAAVHVLARPFGSLGLAKNCGRGTKRRAKEPLNGPDSDLREEIAVNGGLWGIDSS